MQGRMPWEKLYIEALIDSLNPSGNVLVVGFNLGHAADRIQTYHPKHLTIIESDSEAVKQAQQWASRHSNVTVLHQTWQSALPSLGSFDAIFFDGNPLQSAVQLQETARSSLSKGKEVVSMVDKTLPQLKTMRYCDQDLEEFYKLVGPSNAKAVARFLCELKTNQQISDEQYDRMIEKYDLERHALPSSKKQIDVVLGFLEDCLKSHMGKGSRFSCFSRNPISRFEDPQFFERIITNIDLDYRESFMPVDNGSKALIMVVEKVV